MSCSVLESELKEATVNAQESVVPDFPRLHSHQKVLFFFLKGFLAPKSRELFMEVGSGGLCLLH